MPGSGHHSAKFDSCVEKVTKSGSADNAYAVCTTSVGRDDSLTHKHGGDQGTAGSGHAGGLGHGGGAKQ